MGSIDGRPSRSIFVYSRPLRHSFDMECDMDDVASTIEGIIDKWGLVFLAGGQEQSS